MDQIAKHAKPIKMPIEQTFKYELMIKPRVVRVIGSRIPEDLLLRADEVIR